jgi:asparagine synthase (glutamine-hydrolysing)
MRGWVDWDSPSGPADPSVREGDAGLRIVSSPCFEIEVDPEAVDLAVAEARVLVIHGNARLAGEPTSGKTDPWPILRRLIAQGAEALREITGRYAVVFLDLRRRTLLLATDRFAVWPLCYAVEGGRLAFSDRADAVPTRTGVELDNQALLEYLYFHVIPAPRTVFREVRRLDAAEALVFDERGAKTWKHWLPRFLESTSASLPELSAEFRTLLEGSVAEGVADHSAGCFLSGGTDSSTVAGFLRQVTGKPPRTFSIGFEAEGYDEMEYARIAARHFGAEHHEHYVTCRDLLECIPDVAASFDQPFGNSSVVPAYCCARMARQSGVETLLAGDGGDELFAGNLRYAKQRIFALYSGLPRLVRKGAVEPALLASPDVLRSIPIARKAASYVDQARIPMPERMNTYNLLTRLGLDQVLEEEFVRSVDVGEIERQQKEVFDSATSSSLVNQMLFYDWKYTLADNDLPKVREATRLAGEKVAFPLLDDRIVDFSLRLPPNLKLKGLRLRYFFKEALRGFLPDEILAKKKHGFGLPFGVWLARDRELQAFASGAMDRLRGQGIVRDAFLDQLLSEKLREHPGYYGEMVWVLMMLGCWMDARARTRKGF